MSDLSFINIGESNDFLFSKYKNPIAKREKIVKNPPSVKKTFTFTIKAARSTEYEPRFPTSFLCAPYKYHLLVSSGKRCGMDKMKIGMKLIIAGTNKEPQNLKKGVPLTIDEIFSQNNGRVIKFCFNVCSFHFKRSEFQLQVYINSKLVFVSSSFKTFARKRAGGKEKKNSRKKTKFQPKFFPLSVSPVENTVNSVSSLEKKNLEKRFPKRPQIRIQNTQNVNYNNNMYSQSLPTSNGGDFMNNNFFGQQKGSNYVQKKDTFSLDDSFLDTSSSFDYRIHRDPIIDEVYGIDDYFDTPNDEGFREDDILGEGFGENDEYYRNDGDDLFSNPFEKLPEQNNKPKILPNTHSQIFQNNNTTNFDDYNNFTSEHYKMMYRYQQYAQHGQIFNENPSPEMLNRFTVEIRNALSPEQQQNIFQRSKLLNEIRIKHTLKKTETKNSSQNRFDILNQIKSYPYNNHLKKTETKNFAQNRFNVLNQIKSYNPKMNTLRKTETKNFSQNRFNVLNEIKSYNSSHTLKKTETKNFTQNRLDVLNQIRNHNNWDLKKTETKNSSKDRLNFLNQIKKESNSPHPHFKQEREMKIEPLEDLNYFDTELSDIDNITDFNIF